MNIQRIAKHLLTTDGHVRRLFPASALSDIELAIKDSERAHDGEVRVVIEGALEAHALLHGQSARDRAIEVFSQLRVWDTRHNNGLLVYLLLADRAVEIVADRGIDEKVASDEWSRVCRQMEAGFKQANYAGGLLDGIRLLNQHLVEHFPASRQIGNELPDAPVVL